MARKHTSFKPVEALTHDEASRRNIPTAEHQPLLDADTLAPIRVAYERRNRDLDPQLVWRGKDAQDESDLIANAPPLYIQEKVHPKALIDELQRESREREHDEGQLTPDLFADFNGLPKGADRTDFYQFDANWQNRMILGDSLQVMASLAEREGLRGKVQCIYFDPPYGIKFNSNFQWSTTSRDVKDGKADHITREPEQVKAFRDTWRDGIHSYLTYLRDRLTVARDLLTESGSIFVQIGDENVHRVRAVMDEVFGDENFISQITVVKTSSSSTNMLAAVNDHILWFARNRERAKYRKLYLVKKVGGGGAGQYTWIQHQDGEREGVGKAVATRAAETDVRVFRPDNITSQRPAGDGDVRAFDFDGKRYTPGKGTFKSDLVGLSKLRNARRLLGIGKTLCYVRFLDDFAAFPIVNNWADTGTSGFGDPKTYVVQTLSKVIERCILMTTDPGDLVLDPTCGSGTTATVAEQWGRRWITIDTSRVALALARARIMGARYPYYLLADSRDGQQKEAEVTRSVPRTTPTYGNIAHGFVYQRVPHITLKAIANNSEIDVIWDKFEAELAPLRETLTAALPDGWLADYRSKQNYTAEVPDEIAEWEVPRDISAVIPAKAGIHSDDVKNAKWTPASVGVTKELQALLQDFWQLRIARQREIDASIAAKADHEYLYDKPYEDKKRVRVAGPFTVESLSPHRMLGVDEDDELIDPAEQINESADGYGPQDFVTMILDNLRTAGVQQAHRDGAIHFTSLTPWPGDLICAEGRYTEGEDGSGAEQRAAIFIGPEFGTVTRPDLLDAAREAADADFDVLIACAFNFEAHTTDFEKLGRMPVLKARMNADLHMAADLKNTGKGNLFVIFGEPDIDILETDDGRLQVQVNGVDVFHPNTGEVQSDGPEGIACWFLDSSYDSESFFVRHAYFLGAADPYKSLKTTLKAEINEDAWDTLHSATSRPFDKPPTGRIAVKVINHLGDEVMKVFKTPGTRA